METVWKINEYTEKEIDAYKNTNISPLVSALLCSRGLSVDAAKKLISTDKSIISNPMQFADMDKAVERIKKAITNREKVVVYGDYDVDGITSSTLMGEYLRSKGLECDIYIPDRLKEGYGVNSEAIVGFKKQGIKLVITVDCGIVSFDEVNQANALGIDTIITDHHECRDELPNAEAVINPRRKDNKCFPVLAGVGVAFKVICAIEGQEQLDYLLKQYGELVAIGTIADVMPMTDENRIIVKKGLDKEPSKYRVGIKALMQEAGIGGKKLTATNVSFILSPRLNAAGRMGHATLAADLLITHDENEAERISRELCDLNRERQAAESEIYIDAQEMMKDYHVGWPIVFASEKWHQGVAGIVASKLTEKYNVPTMMICINDGIGKGSCRSVGEYNVFEALSNASELLEDFGGHALAAGFTIKEENIDTFRNKMAELYLESSEVDKPKVVNVDYAVLNPRYLTVENIEGLGELEPYGTGNPLPTICMIGVYVKESTNVGQGKHLRLVVAQDGILFPCIMFGHTREEFNIREGDYVDIVFHPQINEFRGIKSVQLNVMYIRKFNASIMRKRFFGGKRMTAREYALLLPRRDDFIKLWKILLKNDQEFDVNGEYYVELKVFEELNLVTLTEQNGKVIVGIDDSKHVNLDTSEILDNIRAGAERR